MNARAKVFGRLAEVRAAFLAVPDAQAWRRCLLVYVAFAASALPSGLASGVLQPGFAPLPPATLAIVALAIFVQPALVEELVFRALLLPRDRTRVSAPHLVAVCAAALAAYVAWHPLNAWLFRPAALQLFSSAAFLACATLLGIACTATYLISRSLWPPVLLHWLSVAAWIVALGGYERIAAG
jgi:uncharacterized protein